jgi:integrase
VFASKTDTELRAENVHRRVLQPARRATGMPWITFHSFRHACASFLFAERRNVKQVQEWLGHADPAFTLRTYVHLLDEGIGDAEFMDDAVRVAGR